jgi:hypothetical protein
LARFENQGERVLVAGLIAQDHQELSQLYING